MLLFVYTFFSFSRYTRTRSSHYLDTLRSYLLDYPDAILGEIGLHHPKRRCSVDLDSLAIQKDILVEQLMLAHELNRPVSIHCVGAHGHLYDLLVQLGKELPPAIQFHSYSGSADMTHSFLSLPTNTFFSFSCFQRWEKVEGLLSVLPAERVLMESDVDGDMEEGAYQEAMEERMELIASFYRKEEKEEEYWNVEANWSLFMAFCSR